jgi:translation initiation factor IF-3
MTNYRRKRTQPKDRAPNYNVNDQINAPELRVLDEEGKMLGVFSRSEVLRMAEERFLDVIEVNPKGNPPVVKFMDYNKFKYQTQKNKANKVAKIDDVKQIRISVRISIHDMEVQARKIEKFLQKDIKVKIQVQMQRREKQHPQVAEETMKVMMGLIKAEYIVENEPMLNGDSYWVSIKPKK